MSKLKLLLNGTFDWLEARWMILYKWYKTPYDWFVFQKELYLGLPLKGLTWLSPNIWCYLRMMLAIAVVYTFYYDYIILATILYIIAIITDVIDGVHARVTNQKSDEGARLDANSDKFLIGVILLFILFVGKSGINGLIISIVLSIELVLLSVANFFKPLLNHRYGYTLTAGSNMFGKTKFTIQAFAVGFLIVASYSSFITMLSEYLLIASIIFGVGSFVLHFYRMDKKPLPNMRIVTVPNAVTFFRVLLLIPAGFALVYKWYNWAILLLFSSFAFDWVDGWLARALNQETLFGAVLDPICDYLSRFYVIIWFFIWFDIPIIRIVIITIILVELFSGAVNLKTAQKYKDVNLVNKWGKYRGTAHYLLLGVVFFHKIGWYDLNKISDYALIFCFMLMLFCSLVALIFYVLQQADHKKKRFV